MDAKTAIKEEFVNEGKMGSIRVDLDRTHVLALGQIELRTVYHVFVRLRNEEFKESYKDQFHDATLRLTDKIIQAVRVVYSGPEKLAAKKEITKGWNLRMPNTTYSVQ